MATCGHAAAVLMDPGFDCGALRLSFGLVRAPVGWAAGYGFPVVFRYEAPDRKLATP